ncbi:hypothetical protein MKZ38_000097 [Zalerion maritima]|uniref:Uncharacterized protein n=1 Tax=Zalerion maritima TaxID=339359 RepID=A0AAD5WUA3_9PEZI|nr:hypothetical protein MKZ38_000097 [Zalerion maritima]
MTGEDETYPSGGEDDELYLSGDEEDDGYGEDPSNPAFFKLDLGYQGESGGYHTRNKPGQKQRAVVTDRGRARKAAFNVSCTAKAIIHGRMDEYSGKPATLLVYDFVFLSYKSSTRIKSADITFEFLPAEGQTDGPSVKEVAPYGNTVVMETTETQTVTMGGSGTAGGGVLGAELSATSKYEKSVKKDTTHATMIIGDKPTDDWGNYLMARWSLVENKSQESGVPSLLRVAIVLERPNDEDLFTCVPVIEAKPDFKTRAMSLFSSRTKDDPIVFDPSFEPYNELDGDIKIDEENLGSLDLIELWDCTFHTKFGQAVKSVKASVSSNDQGAIEAEVKKVTEITVSA